MQSISLSMSNELSALPVLQAAVGAFVQAAGADLSAARQMELVAEEIITNIIKFEYLPGQSETIDTVLSTAGSELEMSIRFRGIPFDIDYLQRCEQVPLEEILTAEGRGIGLHLVRQFCDELQYRNLGNQGQQIMIRRGLVFKDSVTEKTVSDAPDKLQEAPVQAVVRRMLPEESATVSKLAYFAYNYSYVYDNIYDPEQVRALNRDGRMLSYVAVDQEQGEIVGHCALIPDQQSGLYELGVAFVNPRYRGSGCLNDLSQALLDETRAREVDGVFVVAVTSHPYSQKAAIRFGLRETALLVSRVQPVAMRALHEQAVTRETLLYMMLSFENTGRGSCHAPVRHRAMLEQIYENLGMPINFADVSGFGMQQEQEGTLEHHTDHYQAGHIRLISYGRDTLSLVQHILHGWRLDRLETIYLYLPLMQSATAHLTDSFEELGFFFSGVQPGRAGDDLLVLQYLNNQRYDYTALKAATPFGQRLIDYVRSCDPNGC